ncbi:MAG: cytochrome C [Desulfobacteria bacterium]
MTRRAPFAAVFGGILIALLVGCSAVSQTPSVPPKHPEELPAGRVDCLECHNDVSTGALKPYVTFRHSRVFINAHGTYARQGQNLCSSCHAPSFCQTCHARKDEMKPNVKMGNRPDRMAPHRGDYLVTHRIDGRLDPGSCFRCHGNKNDSQCRQCHK